MKKRTAYISRNIFLLFITILFSGLIHQASGQKKWSFEFRPGYNYATSNAGSRDISTGFGFEGGFGIQLLPSLAVYAGWGWNQFSSDQPLTGKEDMEETGYNFGLEFNQPLNKAGISYLIRAAFTYHHIELENSAGNITYNTGHGPGWQLGAGIIFPVGNRLSIVPDIRYRSLSREFNFEEVTEPVDLQYLSAGIGLRFKL